MLTLKQVLLELGGVGGKGVQSKDKPPVGRTDSGDEELKAVLTKQEAIPPRTSPTSQQARPTAPLGPTQPTGGAAIRAKSPWLRGDPRAGQRTVSGGSRPGDIDPQYAAMAGQGMGAVASPMVNPAVTDPEYEDPLALRNIDPTGTGPSIPAPSQPTKPTIPGKAAPGMSRQRAQRQTFTPGTFQKPGVGQRVKKFFGREGNMPSLKDVAQKKK